LFTETDYHRYLINVREISVKHGSIHPDVLMTNHVHPLITPNASATGSALRMQSPRQCLGQDDLLLTTRR
jgi:REP element-mobilizing transposase RayT